MARFLVAYDTIEGQTRKIADYIANRAVRAGHDVRVVDIADLAEEPKPVEFDAVIMGASVHLARHSKRFVQFVRKRRDWLDRLPVAFFSVSLSAGGNEKEREEAQAYIDTLLQETGWKPRVTVTLAGGLKYRTYGLLKRLMIKRIAKEVGRETDASRDYDYTDWQSVDQFTDQFLSGFRAGPHS